MTHSDRAVLHSAYIAARADYPIYTHQCHRAYEPPTVRCRRLVPECAADPLSCEHKVKISRPPLRGDKAYHCFNCGVTYFIMFMPIETVTVNVELQDA